MLFSLASSNCTSRLGTSFVAGSHLLCKTLSSVMELLSPASSARAEAEAVSESWWSPDSWLCCSSRIINLAVFYLSLQRKEPVSGRRLQEVSAHLIGNEVAFLAMRIGGTWPNDREAENTLQKKKKSALAALHLRYFCIHCPISPISFFLLLFHILSLLVGYIHFSSSQLSHSLAFPLLVFTCCCPLLFPSPVSLLSLAHTPLFHSHLLRFLTTSSTCLLRQCSTVRRTS